MEHEGCILPYVAQGTCSICGQSKRLSLPESVPVRVFKSEATEEEFWQRNRQNLKGNVLADKLPEKQTDVPHDLDLLWLPFLYLRFRAGGSVFLWGKKDRDQEWSSRVLKKKDVDVSTIRTLMADEFGELIWKQLGLTGHPEHMKLLEQASREQIEPLKPEYRIPKFDLNFPDSSASDALEYGRIAIKELGHYEYEEIFGISKVRVIIGQEEFKSPELEAELWLIPVCLGYYQTKSRLGTSHNFFLFSGVNPNFWVADVPMQAQRLAALIALGNSSSLAVGILKGAAGLKLFAKFATLILATMFFCLQFCGRRRRVRRIYSFDEMKDLIFTDKPWIGAVILTLLFVLLGYWGYKRRPRVTRYMDTDALAQLINTIE